MELRVDKRILFVMALIALRQHSDSTYVRCSMSLAILSVKSK